MTDHTQDPKQPVHTQDEPGIGPRTGAADSPRESAGSVGAQAAESDGSQAGDAPDREPSETEKSLRMSPDEEQAYMQDKGSQGEPGDGGIGAMTDDQGVTPSTDN